MIGALNQAQRLVGPFAGDPNCVDLPIELPGCIRPPALLYKWAELLADISAWALPAVPMAGIWFSAWALSPVPMAGIWFTKISVLIAMSPLPSSPVV